eukprot:1291712-Pleurochrysis_carterae.AAC.1
MCAASSSPATKGGFGGKRASICSVYPKVLRVCITLHTCLPNGQTRSHVHAGVAARANGSAATTLPLESPSKDGVIRTPFVDGRLAPWAAMGRLGPPARGVGRGGAFVRPAALGAARIGSAAPASHRLRRADNRRQYLLDMPARGRRRRRSGRRRRQPALRGVWRAARMLILRSGQLAPDLSLQLRLRTRRMHARVCGVLAYTHLTPSTAATRVNARCHFPAASLRGVGCRRATPSRLRETGPAAPRPRGSCANLQKARGLALTAWMSPPPPVSAQPPPAPWPPARWSALLRCLHAGCSPRGAARSAAQTKGRGVASAWRSFSRRMVRARQRISIESNWRLPDSLRHRMQREAVTLLSRNDKL